VQFDQRQLDAPPEQRQQFDLDFGPLGLDQVRVLGPFGICKFDPVGQDARSATQLHVKLPGDLEMPAGPLADVAVQRTAQQIPGKKCDQQREQDGEHRNAGEQLDPQRVAAGPGGGSRP
jgi:hypothetical protein